MSISARIRDLWHELVIAWRFAAYRRAVRMAFATSLIRYTWNKYTQALNERSPDQLRRMNRRTSA